MEGPLLPGGRVAKGSREVAFEPLLDRRVPVWPGAMKGLRLWEEAKA